MSSVWGNKLKVSVFGESHGKAIGAVIDGFPAGFQIDFEKILTEMKRRAPGNDEFSTTRKEEDFPNILSGVTNDITNGFPLCAVIENAAKRSSDYESLKNSPRPGHADYTATVKYNGFADMRGGGHFSGRLTAPIVFAGALCKQYLESKGIYISAKILEIHGEKVNIHEEILKAKSDGDSVGGIIECVATGVKAGIGEPMFYSLESAISSFVFSVPAVKGIEFGAGFGVAKLKGSECNDEFMIENGEVKTKTNNSGGILGGISNGMPIVFRVAMKPTPSIYMEQNSINLVEMKECKLNIKGRHDPCIVPRAVPVIEAACAIAILDLML